MNHKEKIEKIIQTCYKCNITNGVRQLFNLEKNLSLNEWCDDSGEKPHFTYILSYKNNRGDITNHFDLTLALKFDRKIQSLIQQKQQKERKTGIKLLNEIKL